MAEEEIKEAEEAEKKEVTENLPAVEEKAEEPAKTQIDIGEIFQNNQNQGNRSGRRPQREMTERQKRQVEKMRNNPEMIQARQELNDEFLRTHPSYAKMTMDEIRQAMLEHAKEDEKLRKQKLRNHIETFSDGIVAVIITIMLLEIPIPTSNRGYGEFISSIGIFFISFVIIANFWFSHHKIFAVTEEIGEGVIVQDFIFTGLLSLIPLLTKWIMVEPSAFSSLNFGVVLIAITFWQEWLNYSLTKEHLKATPKSFKFWRRIWAVRLWASILLNIVITIVAVIFPLYGHWLFVVIPIFSFLSRMINEQDQQQEFYAANDQEVKNPSAKEQN